MLKLNFVVFGILSVFAVGVFAAPFQENDKEENKDELPAFVMKFDWGKSFDASLENNPKRRMLARQYASLKPLSDKMRELFLHERIPAISLIQLEVKQLEICYQLESKLQEKKKCLEVLVFRMKQIQEAQHLFLEQPVRPGARGGQLSPSIVDELVDDTLTKIEWESELEQLNAQLAAKTNQ